MSPQDTPRVVGRDALVHRAWLGARAMPGTVQGSSPSEPHPLFSAEHYRRTVGEAIGDEEPVDHYLRTGLGSPHPLFDPDHYRSQLRSVDTPTEPFLVHYLHKGARLGLSPHPMVDLADLSGKLGPTGGDDPLTYLLLKLAQCKEFDLPLPMSRAVGSAGGDERDWKFEYLVEEQWCWPETFALYRILGNDLPPRHQSGQTLRNVRFILDHEPPLPGVTKRWILNRIVDQEVERRLLDQITRSGHEIIRIPFDTEEYRRVGWRYADFEEAGATFGGRFGDLGSSSRRTAMEHLYHDKNRYAINNNGARNAALFHGRQRATWVLPWDGNCFITEDAWEEIRSGILRNPHLRYVTVPMARVLDNGALVTAGEPPPAVDEPQVVFRADAVEHFDDQRRYGRRPKVDLFYRLGVPGVWDDYRFESWERPRPDPGPDAGRWHRAGWVARLFSGKPELEAGSRARAQSRMDAVRSFIDRLDIDVVRKHPGGTAPFVYRGLGLGPADRSSEVQRILARVRIEEAELDAVSDPASHRLRATLIDLLTCLASDRPSSVSDSVTSLMEAVDASMAEAIDRGGSTYQWEFDLVPALDLLLGVGSQTVDPRERLMSRVEQYRGERLASDLYRAPSNIEHRNTWVDLLELACARLVDDQRRVVVTLRRAGDRYSAQYAADGRHRLRPLDSETEVHERVLSLQGFLLMCHAARRLGLDLWTLQGPGGTTPSTAVRHLLRAVGDTGALRQDASFDRDRLIVLAHLAHGLDPRFRVPPWVVQPETLRAVFPAETGIPPGWQAAVAG